MDMSPKRAPLPKFELTAEEIAVIHAAADHTYSLTANMSREDRAGFLSLSTTRFARAVMARLQYIAHQQWRNFPKDDSIMLPDLPQYATTWGELYGLWHAARRVQPSTMAYRYLTETRGITPPVGGFGEDFCVTADGDLLITAWMPNGMLAGGQLIKLVERDGKVVKGQFTTLGGVSKKSLGKISRGVCTMPGVRPDVVVIAEGPETGASLHAATGYTVLVSCGTPKVDQIMAALSRYQASQTTVLIAMDDDAMGDEYHAEIVEDEIVEVGSKRGRSASTKVLRSMTSRGWDVRPVWPWPSRRYDKSDFNDVLRQEGPSYVLKRVDAVAVGTSRSETIAKLKDLHETDAELKASFAQVRQTIAEYTPLGAILKTPIRKTVATGVGAGKTELAHRLALFAERHHLSMGDYAELGRWNSLVITVPENTLSDEQYRRMQKAVEEDNAANPDDRPLKFGVYRGQGARDTNGQPMCREYAAVLPLIRAKISRQSICAACPSRAGCKFLEQQMERNDIWLTTTATAFMDHMPKAFKDTTFHTLIVDESAIRQIIKDEQRLTADELLDEQKCPTAQWGVDRSTTEAAAKVEQREEVLRDARLKLAGLIRSWPVGHHPTPQEFIDAGLTNGVVSEALNAEWGRLVGMVEGYEFGSGETSVFAANASADVLISVWETIARITRPAEPDGEPAWPTDKPTGWIEAAKIGVRGKAVGARHVRKVEVEIAQEVGVEGEQPGVTKATGGGIGAARKAEKAAKVRAMRRKIVTEAKPGIILRGRRHLNKAFREADIINLNATFLPELERLAIEGLEAVAETISYSPHLHVFQIIDNPVSKAASRDMDVKMATMAATNVLALRTGKHGVLAGSVEFTKWAKAFLPPAVEAANFGRITGNDRWKDGFVVCHAHNLPPAHACEDAIMAATGESIQRGNYISGDVERLMRLRSGGIVSRVDSAVMHPHPLVNQYARLVDVLELVQLLMRTRSMRLATPDNPHYAVFSTSVPLDYPVVGLSWWNMANPPHWVRQITVDGVALANREDAAKLYPAAMLDVDSEGNPLPAGERQNWLALPSDGFSLLANPEWPFNVQVFGDGVVKDGKLPGAPSPFDVLARFEYKAKAGSGAARKGMALPGLLMATGGHGGLAVCSTKVEAFRALLGRELGVELAELKVHPPRALDRAAMVATAHGRFAAAAVQVGAGDGGGAGGGVEQIVSAVLERLYHKPVFRNVIATRLFFDPRAGGAQAVLVAASGLDKLSVSRAVRKLTEQEVDVLRLLSEKPTHDVTTPRARLAVRADGEAARQLLAAIEEGSEGKISGSPVADLGMVAC